MDDWDWDLLQDSSSSSSSSPPSCNCDGVIRSDYFSLDSREKYAAESEVDSNEGSDKQSWIDPTQFPARTAKSESDSGSESRNLTLFVIQPHSACGIGSESDQDCKEASGEEESESSGCSDEKRRVVWWRVPLDVLKYCVLRVSPVWSLSMAAAVVLGLVFLRRRYLYKMKRKSQGLKLNLTVDDKKVSQFTSRAARLNEAFSVVKRVPIIRPSWPAPGLAPWPMVSLR